MYQRLTIYVTLLFILAFSGCVSSNIAKEYSLSNSTGKGLLVLSFTTNEDADNPYLDYRNTKTGDKGEILRNTFKNPLDWESPKGRLVVIELNAGSYEFYRWSVLTQGQSEKEFSVPFDIVSGKATYIGNLQLGILEESSVYGLNVSDQSDRDLKLFHQRYSNVKDTDIVRSISKQHF